MKLDDATLKILAVAKGPPIHANGLVVAAVTGPDSGKQWRIDDIAHRRVLVGQSPACDVKLTDRSVSRRHASIELEGARLRLVDLGSRNGTLVGGFEIKEVFLRAGAEIALGQTLLRVELDAVRHEIPSSSEPRFHRVLGTSAEMRRLYPLFERLVGKATHVLLEGEPGTGKELVAEVLHEAGGNADAPFVVFEPATVAPPSLDGELFGAEGRRGLLERANGGSLFIDEIGDLPGPLQSKLLRAIQRKEISRGEGPGVPVDLRIFASTRMDLDAEVQSRRFREELLLALATPRIELPPLRRRAGDIAFLTQCFWVALGGNARALPPSLVQRFSDHVWPGNVRELYYAVSRVIASGDIEWPDTSAMAAPGSPSDFVAAILAKDLPLAVAREEIIAAFERRYVERVLEQQGGHVGRAAAATGVGRRYFQKLRAKL